MGKNIIYCNFFTRTRGQLLNTQLRGKKMKIIDSRQEAKLNMYDVVALKCGENAAIIANYPALVAAVAEFNAKIADIKSAAQLTAAVLTGIATDKKFSKEEVSEATALIAGQIFAYAAKNQNNTLKNEVNFSATDLRRIKDGELVSRCQAIHDLGIANVSVLGDYGVKAANLAELQTAIDAYAQNAPKPRAAITDRATLKANLRQYFKDADAILKEQMDKLVEPLAKDHADFVSTYKNARKIVDPKTFKKEPGTTNGGGITPA